MASYNTAIPEDERSYFDGGYFAYIGYTFLVVFVTAITLGIAYPWMCCMFQRWKARHTVVCGKRMHFDGTGLQLIGKYLLWAFLSIITLGIYSLWMTISVKKWITKHTHYQAEEDNNSYFDGGVLGMIGTNLLAGLVLAVPFVGLAWSNIIKLRWETNHTVVDSRRHIFVGSVGSLFVKKLLWGLLSVITLGIFGLFMPVKMIRWETENTIDNEHTTQELIARSEYRANVHADAASFKTCKVEDEMECIRAGITDTMPEDTLLALANSGMRAAQYTYVMRYAQGNYTHEPFSGMLKAAAEAAYAPAISLYLQTHPVDESTHDKMLVTAAERGQTWAIKAWIASLAQVGLARKADKHTLPVLKRAVRYADLLKEAQEALTAEEEALVKKCTFTIRRIQSQTPPSSRGRVAGIVIGILIGLPVLIALLLGAVSLITGAVKHIKESSGSFSPGMIYLDKMNSGATDNIGVSEANGGIFYFFSGLSGNREDALESVVSGVDQAIPEGSETNTASQMTETSTFWERFLKQMEEDHCVVTMVDTASDGTVKYEITCNYWYWNSLHYLEILQTADGVQRICFWGQRILEPDSPDPTINEAQWESIIRVIFKELGLGDYDGITPYKDIGDHTDTYSQWDFLYTNNDQEVRLTVRKR